MGLSRLWYGSVKTTLNSQEVILLWIYMHPALMFSPFNNLLDVRGNNNQLFFSFVVSFAVTNQKNLRSRIYILSLIFPNKHTIQSSRAPGSLWVFYSTAMTNCRFLQFFPVVVIWMLYKMQCFTLNIYRWR